MAYGNRYLLVHGHFYQPPRENPWTGQIDPQPSASPWANWNRRIADECYIPMAWSRVYNHSGLVTSLYNNYAHTSFNFGPTLLSWLADTYPDLLGHLVDAAGIDHALAMAQAYSHMMLPLADARDRHTQILWGLREFRRRFGFDAEGMWLPECGIDPETTRALIDHGVKFVILSPHQASRARPFGEREWRDVSMGAIDTRRAYRLFDLDGGGRTHFDRKLDILFYTPGLNLKVSFEHILNRPDDLARELENCFKPDSRGAQLASIVTDGEIYGHHEKRGEEALSRLFRDIAPAVGVAVTSAGAFLRDNPPSWEVKLWNGEDHNGSSWSCEHGMGRWSRDCGCRPPSPPGWNQAWRGPLRAAFDTLRDQIRSIARRELGGLLWDVDEAVNDYIEVVLAPEPATRLAFIRRHARRELDLPEVERLWRILEALRHAMLMYTSCGWFFDELSGLEPVQNMRYALRAAELVQPYRDGDLEALLETELAKAKSNLPHFGDGGKVFRELVLPTRHSNRELAAAVAICLAVDLPRDSLSWRLIAATETVKYADNHGNQLAWGSFVCHEPLLDRFIRSGWVARLDDFENSGVGLHGYEEVQGDPARADGQCPLAPDPDFSWLRKIEDDTRNMKRQELLNRFETHGIAPQRLPEAIRGMLYRKYSAQSETLILEEAARVGAGAVPFLNRARRHGAMVPDAIEKIVTNAFEQDIAQATFAAVAGMAFGSDAIAAMERPFAAARELGLHPNQDLLGRSVYLTALELLHWLITLSDPAWLAPSVPKRLPDGSEWLQPRCPVNHNLDHPWTGGLSFAMGKGLAKLRGRLLAEPDIRVAAMLHLPVPEILDYAKRVGLEVWTMPPLGIAYWELLGPPLASLVAADPAGLLSAEAGDRIRLIGRELGFAEDTVEKRIIAALREGME